ncbi:NUDIX domain-containing protein [Psychromarinibacter sp. C21-152]|uniref:NUDIX domain-containing protein n=1 Tax=Psychromarinibacter sediminicola TaxID=3033385 RepID=A0AAE3NW24_9RHOB|nr:NUDIX domain-containing protein [Psychromarinibacter sediminicola]MDF0601697.1 NUDIX domain-containing protein [Psychromarinibacter sediminicola]
MPYSYEYPHPAVTADVIVFSIIEGRLNVVLIRRAAEPFKDCWALPGGFVQMDEDLKAGARRELAEEAGISPDQLAGLPFFQIGAYGHPDRDPRERVITVAFATLVPMDRVSLVASTDAAEVQWFPLDDLPPLAFDHATILSDARAALARMVETRLTDEATAVFAFLPEAFTLAQAQSVFEIVKGQDLDKRNFRKWIDANWEIEDLKRKTTGGRHRPAALFRLVGLKAG